MSYIRRAFEGEKCYMDNCMDRDCDEIPYLEDFHFVRLVREEEYRKPILS